jgi:DNA-binding NarL/FixJ family response regulator
LAVDGSVTGRGALTPAEQAVARLAAQRFTNPEIAEQLVVSRKTVEYHLSHVYAKLGVRNRVELARQAES